MPRKDIWISIKGQLRSSSSIRTDWQRELPHDPITDAPPLNRSLHRVDRLQFEGFCCKLAVAIWYGDSVIQKRPALFRGRHFEDVVIVLCVRWYLRYSLSYRDLEEMMAERGLSIDHVTVWRWVQRYAPVLNQRIRRELRRPNRSWRVDETYVKIAGNWAYLV